MLDGANSWRRFWGITLPLMTPVILYDIILGVSLGLQIFTQVFIIFGNNPPGSPVGSTLMYVPISTTMPSGTARWASPAPSR